MLNENLNEELEWISGKTKIYLSINSERINIHLYPNFPKTDGKIDLFLKINQFEKKVEVLDLVGNGFGTTIQDKGFGTKAFNLGIQAIYRAFGLEFRGEEASSIEVFGKLSTSGDASSEPEKSKCGERRIHFWTSFGFKLIDPNCFESAMKSSLLNLIINRDKPDLDSFIDLNSFWLLGNEPIVLEKDICALKVVEINKLDLSKVPSKEDLDKAYNSNSKGAENTTNLAFLCLLFFTFYLKIFEGLNVEWDVILFLMIALYFGLHLLVINIMEYTPKSRYTKRITKERADAVNAADQHIQIIESENNGLIWRLYPFVSDNFKEFKSEKYQKLSQSSYEQKYTYLSDNIDDYHQFMLRAKELSLREFN